jgi:hypothetical protein
VGGAWRKGWPSLEGCQKKESWPSWGKRGSWSRESLLLEGIYNGCTGCVHAPPPLLAAHPKFLIKLPHFSISLRDFGFFW